MAIIDVIITQPWSSLHAPARYAKVVGFIPFGRMF